MHLPVLLPAFIAAVAALQPRAPQVQKTPKNVQRPAETPRAKAATSHGCFAAEGEWEDIKGYESYEPSMGFCINLLCNKDGGNYTVVATRGSQCLCGYKYPPKDTLVDDSKCNFACPGFDQESCGGIDGKFWSVYNTGVEVAVPYLEPEAETSSAVDTAPSSTAPAEDDKKEEGGKGANVGGIVAGVVVAVVAIAGSIAGVFFYLRRKRNKEIEEEHRRNAAVNSFIGHKPPSTSDGLSISDTRLDPVMAHRRLSDGSIADNQDYSRRILKVTNA